MIRAPGSTFDAIFRVTNVNGFGGSLVCNGTVDGLVEIVWFSFSPLVNDGDGPPNDLFKINFTVQAPNGSVSPLTFTDVEVQQGAVTAVGIPGSVTINSSTAAAVRVAGRVLTQDGRPVAKALISLRNAGGEPRFALSNPFGYFQFDNVLAGEAYVVTASSIKYTFKPRVLNLSDEITNLDFVAQP